MQAAKQVAMAMEAEAQIGTGIGALPYPGQWNGPSSPAPFGVRDSEPLAVMVTEGGLEEYRRRKRADERVKVSTS